MIFVDLALLKEPTQRFHVITLHAAIIPYRPLAGTLCAGKAQANAIILAAGQRSSETLAIFLVLLT